MAAPKRSTGITGIRANYPRSGLAELNNQLNDEASSDRLAPSLGGGGSSAAYPARTSSYARSTDYRSPYAQQPATRADPTERSTSYGGSSLPSYTRTTSYSRTEGPLGGRTATSSISSDPRLRGRLAPSDRDDPPPPPPEPTLGRPRPVAGSRYAQESVLNPRGGGTYAMQREEDRRLAERERERERARDQRLVLRSREPESESDSSSEDEAPRGRGYGAPARAGSSGVGGSGGGYGGAGPDRGGDSGGGGYGSKGRRVGGEAGLTNLGNTCFMNSIVQCLSNTPELAAFCLQHGGGGFGGDKGLMRAFVDLVRNLWTSTSGAVTPREFLSTVGRWDSRFKGGRQHDSQEFLHSLLDGLQADSNRIKGKPKYKELDGKGSEEQQAAAAWEYAKSWHDSPIDDVFRGQLQSTIECHTCHRNSHCFDPFLDLSVPIPKSSRTSIGHETSIEDCLGLFTETEKLDGRDGYKCEHCKKVTAASKRLRIYRYPPVLILHLKRFAQGTGLRAAFSSFSKNNSMVRFATEGLDITRYCADRAAPAGPGRTRPVYDLFAVSNHSGSLGGGHYTAYARNVGNGSWYHYNDSSVSTQSAGGTNSSSAYVLFYRLRDQSLPSL